MKKFFNWPVTLIFPAFIFLSSGRTFFALVALLLQATVIGWIPAAIWAYATWSKDLKEDKKEAKQKPLQPVPSTVPKAAETISEQKDLEALAQKPEEKI